MQAHYSRLAFVLLFTLSITPFIGTAIPISRSSGEITQPPGERSKTSRVVQLTSTGVPNLTSPPPPPVVGTDKILYSMQGVMYTINPDGSGKTNLGGGIYSAWSPDGTKIAFIGNTGTSQTAFYVINADGSGRTRVTFSGAHMGFSAPSWSPDGQKLAVEIRETENEWSTEIYVANANGSGATRLTNNSRIDGEPQWSPDGQKIYFSSNRADLNTDIYSMNPDGTNVTRLTNLGYPTSGAGSFGVSPDGTKIAFVRFRSPYEEINVMDAAGGPPTVLGEFYTPVIASRLVWSHDSSLIAFQVIEFWDAQGNRPMVDYMVSPAGGGFIKVADNDSETPHDWSPDDSAIVYSDKNNIYVVTEDNGRVKIDSASLPNGITTGHRPTWRPRPPCNCPTITKPSEQTLESTWPDPTNRLNWSLKAEVTDRDGLVLTDIKLGPRYMAKKISVPYYNLQTSAFTNQGELKPDNVEPDGSRRTRLVDYHVTQNDERLVVEATYAIDEIPAGSKSCLQVIQRYEFYRQGVGGFCEPSEKLPCSRWKADVKYKFFGQLGQTLEALNIPQRRHFTVDNNLKNSIGLFKDCDYPGACLPHGILFERKENPLFDEWYGRVIENGISNNVWDNIHQTQFDSIEEPGIDITLQNWSFMGPGCPECMHSHWRWSKFVGQKWGHGRALIPPGSKQHFDFAVVKNQPGEDHPADFPVLANRERIRHPATGYDPPRQVFDFSAPDDVVLWYSATGHQSGDVLYEFYSFFSGSVPNVQLYAPSGMTQQQQDANQAQLATLESDEISSVVVANLYDDGETTVEPVDPNILGPLPAGYTSYNNLSFDIETEAKTSGPDVTTFSVPSVTDPEVFSNLRIFHAEQDPFEPSNVIWVDRTILPPDALAPDFTTHTISARTRILGQFVVGLLTTPQPAPGTADISVASGHFPAQVMAGSNVTYTFNITNNGPDSATGIRLMDILPPTSEFVSVTPSQGNCEYTKNGKMVCKLGSLNPSTSATLSIVVTLKEGGLQIPSGGLEVGNTLDARANENDANLNDNSATENVMLLADPNIAPTVLLTSPSNGNLFVGPATINVTATASDSDGSIASVELFDKGSSIGTAVNTGTNEYSFNWTNVPFGNHSVMAIVTDNNGKQSVSEAANIVVNGSANVSLIEPMAGGEYPTSTNINITANASKSGGSITKVDFYVDGELLGTGVPSGTNKYSITWNPWYSGNYFLTAIATDNLGITTTSPTIGVTARKNVAPSVNITTPTNGSQFASPGNVVMSAMATDTDGAIAKVDFYANGTKIGTGSTFGNQYNFTWSNPGTGSYALTAIAVDDTNQSTTSSAVNITVSSPPTVGITSPANGIQYTAPAQVTVVANATDSDGSIARTDFYANGGFIGTGTLSGTNQYTFNWTNVGIGNYALVAVAIDNGGLSTTSAVINVSVTSPVLFVTNSTTLNDTENSVKTRLEALNHTVIVKAAASATTADATGKALVVISSTVTPSAVGTKFRTVAVPVLTWESGIYNNMGMTGSTNKDFGTKTNQTQVNITNPTHSLAAGFSGNVTVASSGTFNWGKPNANAISVAIAVGDSAKTLIFGYDTGAVMPSLTAPARRVGFFMHDNTTLNSSGIQLLDSAIRWARGVGSLTGSLVVSQGGPVDLSVEGIIDWAHWGLGSPTKFDHKAGIIPQVSNYTKLGSSSVMWLNDNPTTFSWSDGTPTASIVNTPTGVFVNGTVGNGFEITLPADPNLKTLKLYLGLWNAQGKLEATLSDGSAGPYVDTELNSNSGTKNGVYTILFKAGSTGQTLKLRYTLLTNHFAPHGNVTLEAATLRW